MVKAGFWLNRGTIARSRMLSTASSHRKSYVKAWAAKAAHVLWRTFRPHVMRVRSSVCTRPHCTDLHESRMRVLHAGKYYEPYRGGIETALKTLCGVGSGEIINDVLVANVTARTVVERVGNIDVVRAGT